MEHSANAASAARQAPASSLYRRVWRWHFFAGLLCLPFIFSLALTGAVYLFNKQIDDLVHADLLLRAEAVRGQPLPASAPTAGRAEAVSGRCRSGMGKPGDRPFTSARKGQA